MSILNNISSLNAQRSLYNSGRDLQNTMGQLSSGTRIVRASDDAAGLAISEKLRAEIRGINQATRNTQDAVSMIQTAEGAMEEIHAMLQRMRELAVQASNDTLELNDRAFINDELGQLAEQINDIGDRTEFNGKTLLAGALSSQLSTASEVVPGSIIHTSDGTAVTNVDVSGVNNAATAPMTLTLTGDTTSNTLTLTDAVNGITQNLSIAAINANSSSTLDFSVLGVKITIASNVGSTSTEIIQGFTQATNNEIVIAGAQTAGTGTMEFMTGPDEGDTMNVSFRNVKIETTNNGGATEMAALHARLSEFTNAINANAGTDQLAAENLIGELDDAIAYISEHRAELGAFQNRMEYTINNLQQTSNNLVASESRIRDVDVAQASADLAKSTVLQQAAVSVLAQANQQPQLALKLLG
tara:strand:+ start:420 stop:1661 length:1242 start_codon:yes stop_codon:yes gene_type:complete